MKPTKIRSGLDWLLALLRKKKHDSSSLRPDTETQKAFSLFRNRHYSPRELRTIRNTAVAAHLTLEMALNETQVDDAKYFVKKAEGYCLKIINKMQ